MSGGRDIWERLREGADVVQRLREPPGILSKTSPGFIFAMIVLAVVAYRLSETWALVATGIFAIVAFFIFQKINLDFAVRHPDLASTQGREWLQYQKWSASAKGAVALPPSDPTTNPQYIEQKPSEGTGDGA